MFGSGGCSVISDLSDLLKINIEAYSDNTVIPAIKTDEYFFYSVPDPHKEGFRIFFKNFFLKDSLKLNESHHVLGIKVPITFAEYKSRRNAFLLAIGNNSGFSINKPKYRDILVALLRRKFLKEIVYGEKISMAFYEITRNNNYIELIYTGKIRVAIRQICNSLEKLLLTKP